MGLLLGLATTSAAWASTPPLWLIRHETVLNVFALVLSLAVLGLLSLEFAGWRKERDVARLALALEQQRLEIAEQQAAAEEAAASAAPALNPLLAGRPRQVANDGPPRPTSAPPPPSAGPPPGPPASLAPPPPPSLAPPPSFAGSGAGAADNSNPFARLASIGSESAGDTVNMLGASKPSPISLPSMPQENPSATESGGWADLMQKVRSAKESEAPFAPPSRPAAEAPKASAPDAWEALLKKTAAASAVDNPFAGGDSRPSPVPQSSANPFASLGGGSTGALPPPPPAPEEPAEPLPDFIRKASRTISLDSFKSGEGKL